MTAPLKVVHIASGDLWGGAEVQLFTLAKELQKDPNIQLDVILMNQGVLAEKLQNRKINLHIIDEQQLGALQIIHQLRKLFFSLQPDIIHTHRQKENALASLANLLSVRTVSLRTQHGAPEFHYSLLQPHKLAFKFTDWFCGRYLQKQIIAVSDELAEKLATAFPRSRITVVENGVDIDEVLSQASLPADFKIQQPEYYHIGIVGRLVPVKRIDIFLETAKLLLAAAQEFDKPLLFHVIGDGPLYQQLEQQAQELSIEKHLRFHGHRSDIASCLASLDVLLMCSDHEGLPMTALEAMTVGTPIVSNNIGALKQHLKRQVGGILSQMHDAASYQQCIARLLKSDHIELEFDKAGTEQLIEHRLSAKANYNAIKSLYSAVLASH